MAAKIARICPFLLWWLSLLGGLLWHPQAFLTICEGKPTTECWCVGTGSVERESPNWEGQVEESRMPKRGNKRGHLCSFCSLDDGVWGRPPTRCWKPLEQGICQTIPPTLYSQAFFPSVAASWTEPSSRFEGILVIFETPSQYLSIRGFSSLLSHKPLAQSWAQSWHSVGTCCSLSS